jgi:hypothetical protein
MTYKHLSQTERYQISACVNPSFCHMNNLSHLYLVFLFLFNTPSFSSSERKASNLDSTPSTFITPSNQAYFDDQMSGEMSNYWKKLGALPYENTNFYTLFYQLSNAKSRSQSPNTIHVGLIPLPYSKKDYLGWVYWESTPDRRKLGPNGFGIISNSLLSFGIFIKNDLNSFELKKNLKPVIHLDLGKETELARFDFANYDLGPLGRAIGVRTTVNWCGAGGSICSNEDLRLYSTNSPAIREVLHSMIGYFGVYAGDWHKDGTRDHFSEELPGVLILNSYKNEAYPHVLIKALFRNIEIQKEYSISKNSQNKLYYQTTDREIFPHVQDSETFTDLEKQIKRFKQKK